MRRKCWREKREKERTEREREKEILLSPHTTLTPAALAFSSSFSSSRSDATHESSPVMSQ